MHRRLCAASLGLMAVLVAAKPAAAWERQLEQGGVRATVNLQPLHGETLEAGAPARLRVALATAHDGSPVARVLPGVWIDAVDPAAGEDDAAACQRRIGRYARASGLNPQALLVLGGYDVLVLNADASISVLDPRTQLAGRTSLRATLPLSGPGFDWAATPDDARLFVSVPSAFALVVADLVTMRPTQSVKLPGRPARLRLHPTGDQVWVGVPEGTGTDDPGGVAVVASSPPHRVKWLPLARGHVEMAFDPAGWVALTQRDTASVSFVDPTTLQVARTAALPQGARPVGVIFDAPARRFVVADAHSGHLYALDHRGRLLTALSLKAGIGPMSVSRDGRWLLVANPASHHVDVVDLSAWRHAHRLPVSGRPFEIAQTEGYAYIRALDSEAVVLVSLASLATSPRMQAIPIGERPPGRTPNLPIAAQMVPMPDGTGGFIASPGDNAVYYYMEGMNAAAGSVSARGHEARAVRVAHRGLRETAPGRYELDLTLPTVARIVLALATDSPRTRQCVTLELAPAAARPLPAWELAWDALPAESAELSLRIGGVGPEQMPSTVHLKLFRPGGGAVAVNAVGDGDGRYVAQLPDLEPGLWYVHPVPPPASGATWGYVSFVRRGGGS